MGMFALAGGTTKYLAGELAIIQKKVFKFINSFCEYQCNRGAWLLQNGTDDLQFFKKKCWIHEQGYPLPSSPAPDLYTGPYEVQLVKETLQVVV